MYKHLKETKEFSSSQCDLNSSTSSNDFDINVYNGFIKKTQGSVSLVKPVWSLCNTDGIVQIAGITAPSVQWKGILKGLFCFSPLLSLEASVGQVMSVEFLADMKMGRAAKALGDKGSIQNYAASLKECSNKSRMD